MSTSEPLLLVEATDVSLKIYITKLPFRISFEGLWGLWRLGFLTVFDSTNSGPCETFRQNPPEAKDLKMVQLRSSSTCEKRRHLVAVALEEQPASVAFKLRHLSLAV